MSKTGKKLLAAASEAIMVARGDFSAIKKIRVTPSCGCVFCDMGLEPTKMKRQWVHYDRKQGIAVCTSKGIKSNE